MGRGPSYPYVGLEEAIGLTRKVYDYAKRGTAPNDSVVAEAWKYSATSSGAQKTLAAVRAFGLVEDAPGTNGKALRVSNRAIRILLDEPDSHERKEEIRKAALAPKWYEYCWKTWGKEMPPSMRSNLLIEHGFVESTVEGFLKDYRKTIAFAGLLDDRLFGNSEKSSKESEHSFKIGDYVQWESQGILRMPEAKRLMRFEEGHAFVEGSLTGIPEGELIPGDAPESKPEAPQNILPTFIKPGLRGEANVGVESFALSEGGFAIQVSWPRSITEEGLDDFIYQLRGLEKKVRRALKKDIEDVRSQDEAVS